MNLKKIIIPSLVMAAATTATGQGIGIRLENMDPQARPGTDFYQYACGGWMKANPLKPEYARFGSFNVVHEENQRRIREIIEGLAAQPSAPGSLARKIGDLYALRMDSVRLNKDGLRPVRRDLRRVEKVRTKEELADLVIQLSTEGVSFGELWDVSLGADMMESTRNLLSLSQGGYTIERDYYVEPTEANRQVMDHYRRHIVNIFRLLGDTEQQAQARMERIVALETRMARAARSNADLRDPASNYHKSTYADFKRQYPGYDWDSYFQRQGFTDPDFIDVGQPEALSEALAALSDTPLQALKDALQWGIIQAAGSQLGDELYAEIFDFHARKLSGQQEPQPRWKRAVSSVNSVLGEAVGQLYVERYFPPANKARMQQLIADLRTALGQRIDAQDWMSPQTKRAAHEKLDAFRVKVGYPDRWRDYSALDIDPKKTLYENMKQVHRWAHQDILRRKWKQPVDPDEWYMTPQTVNAYYNPTTNEICFPAGILQYPFFDMEADDAFNYGAIGVVIGHEMSHGFDDQGRQFDKQGNFRDWWAEGDGQKYTERAQVIKDFFSAIRVLPDLHANGDLCCGENLGDHGGLKFAYTALQNAMKERPLGTKEGFTPEQRFFLAYAGVWACNITEAEIRRLTAADPHSLGRWRVNGALPLIDAWYDAFGITEADPLFVPKERRVKIW